MDLGDVDGQHSQDGGFVHVLEGLAFGVLGGIRVYGWIFLTDEEIPLAFWYSSLYIGLFSV